jgi:hypothetical protein
LQKDRAERLHDIADARLELKEAPATVPAPVARPRPLAWMIAAALATAIALVLALIHFHETQQQLPAARFPLLPPEKTSFNEIAVSPDERSVAFTARDAAGTVQLWIRPLDSLTAQALGGTKGASMPFWSPDSRWIGFFAEGKLKKGGSFRRTTAGRRERAKRSRGRSGTATGVILFGLSVNSPLMQVPASGGEPKQASELDTSIQCPPRCTWTDVAYQYGYHDQMHLVHLFRQ